MKVLAIFAFALCVAVVAGQGDLHDLPAFPSLAQVDSTSTVVAGTLGPDNNILNGRPLKVPIIVDPFTQTPGSDAAQTLDRITQVLTMEPPSAAQPEVPAVDQVDVLEVLNFHAKEKAKRTARKMAKAKAKAAAAAGVKGNVKLTDAQIQSMAAVKNEMKVLNDLIKKASKIQSELPKKKARLQLLKKKLHTAATKTAKKLAGKKAGAQAKVASDVENKIKILKTKLSKLENAKQLLNKSISGLKKVAEGKAVDAALIQQLEEEI